jgi:hypothetical protein
VRPSASRRASTRRAWFADVLNASAKRMAREYATDAEFNELYLRAFPLMFARYGNRERRVVERLRKHGDVCDRRTLESFNDQAASFDLRPDLGRIEAETLV